MVDDGVGAEEEIAEVRRKGQRLRCTRGDRALVRTGLFGWVALTYDPDEAGGLDEALHTVRSQPPGEVLLSALALGFAAFGVCCLVGARPKT